MAKKDKTATIDGADLLDLAVAQVRSAFGVESIHPPGEDKVSLDREVLPTGMWPVDDLLGIGGIVKGSITMIAGPEGAGKSTLALQVLAEAQKVGLNTLFIDAEHGLNPDYAKKLGIDMDKMYISQPGSFEEAFGVLETLVATGQIGVVVVDSLAALAPVDELEKKAGEEPAMALFARKSSTWLRKFNPVIAKTGTIVICINQLREKVGGYGGGTVLPGGRAWKFYSGLIVMVKPIEALKNADGQWGTRVKIEVLKNRFGRPFRNVEMNMVFGEGLDLVRAVVDAAVDLGVIKKSGSWFDANPSILNGAIHVQGIDNLTAYVKERPELREEIERVINSLGEEE